MKKLFLVATAAVILSGCQITGDDSKSIADVDFDSMSCDQIKQTFTDYQDNMDNADTGSSLLSSIGVDAGTSEARSVMQKSYYQAKKVAKPAMKAKKCKFSV